MKTIDILGYRVSVGGLASDVNYSFEESTKHRAAPFIVACANPHSLVEAASDSDFQHALEGADLLLPDGAGIVLAGKILGTPIRERVAGMEFFLEYSRVAQLRGSIRYFFLGSSEAVLASIRSRVASDFPAIEVAGTYSPPFKTVFSEHDNTDMLQRINAASPDVLWVGMTAPKQEKWIHEHRSRLRVPMAAAIGAVFDFYAGSKKRAPAWVQNIGLEWLPRLIREPRRLARRNFISSPVFLARVLAQKVRGQVQ